MVPGPPSGEGWAESEEWIPRARRLGPLRYSDLGRRALDPVPPGALAGLASWLAARVDLWWEEAGFPDPYTLVVVSGDDGSLAAAVLEAGPKCAAALRYVVVNPDVAGRTEPPDTLVRLVPLEDPVFLYPARRRDAAGSDRGADPDFDPNDLDDLDLDDVDDPAEQPPARGIGPLATFLTDVPALGEGDGAVVAIEVLSRLPYDLYEWGEEGWSELRVAADGEELREIALPVAEAPAPAPVAFGRWAGQTGAAGWLRRVIPSANAARLAVVDEWAGPPGHSGLDLDQLAPVREPLDPAPVPVAGTPYAAVTWKLGDRTRRF